MMSERFDRAFQLASELHREQTRKGCAVPYISHLMSVAALVIEHGGDEDQAIAALLHDAVEDQGGLPTLERIRSEFGPRVARIVHECSDSDGGPHKPEWKLRKQSYLDHIATKSDDALLVTLADKLHNARSIITDHHRQGELLWQRFTGKRDGTLWYYAALAEAFKRREAPESARVLVSEFSRAVERLKLLSGKARSQCPE
jgi:(p)ppGpp synthase/HD superfamily hydrolase